MKNNSLVMPASYTAMNEKEMNDTVGGGFLASIFSAFSQIFNFNYKYTTYNSNSATQTNSQGAVVSNKSGVYTGSIDQTVTKHEGDSITVSGNVGNIFGGLSKLCRAFGL